MRTQGKTKLKTIALLGAIAPLAACSAGPGAASDVQVTTSALSDPTLILGFEDATLWTTSQGTKSLSTAHSQGAKSLALQSFTFTAVTSAALATPSGVTPTLLLDVMPPAPPAWGQVQLFVSIPSRNVYNAPLSAVPVTGLPSTQFSTLSFSIPAAIVTALQQSYNDLTFQITVNAPQSSQSFLLDNLRFQGSAPASSKVEIQASNVDDLLTVTDPPQGLAHQRPRFEPAHRRQQLVRRRQQHGAHPDREHRRPRRPHLPAVRRRPGGHQRRRLAARRQHQAGDRRRQDADR